MENGMLLNSVAIISTLIVGWGLFNKRVRLSPQWRATVTPLASIIGSGFLIVDCVVISKESETYIDKDGQMIQRYNFVGKYRPL